jgi:hypothetical protein
MGNRANRRERETEREQIIGERSSVGGERKMAWVDFDHWLKSTPEYF